MKLELTEKQAAYQQEFEEFVKREVIPYSDKNDLEENMPHLIIEKMAERGYLGSMIPEQYGGMGLDMITIGLLNEEAGKGCSSIRGLLTVHGMVALALLRWGTDEQKNTYLPRMARGEIIGAFALTEPNVGSDAKSVEATAVRDGDDYILNGKKKWTTLGQIADVIMVFAKCNENVSAFLVEKGMPGFTNRPMKNLFGARASMIAELELDNVKVPSKNLVGTEGTGLSHVALACLDYGRYTVAWGCVGLGQACLEESIEYAGKRTQFGVPLRSNQLIQKMITEMVVEVKAARLLCFNAGYLKDQGDPDTIMETWNAKYYASKMANKVASDAMQIHGANGFTKDYKVERYLRDARINEIIEGTTQIHEVLIATNAFRYS